MLRPQGAGRRLRLIGSSSIVAGLVLLATGVYCVTTLNGPSFHVNTFAGAQPTVRDYVLLVIELAVTAGGAYTLFYGIVTLRKGRKQITFARSMHLVDAEFVADPKLSASNRCWQCGSKVRTRNAICYRCGATQRQGSAFRQSMQTGVLPEPSGTPAPLSSGPLPTNGAASSPTGAPLYPSYPPSPSFPSFPSTSQPHPYEMDARTSWESSGDPPTDDDAGPRTYFPWR